MNNEPDLTRKDRKEESKEKVQRSEAAATLYNKYTICQENEKKSFSCDLSILDCHEWREPAGIDIYFNPKPSYMKRSVFLQIPFVASALFANAKDLSKDRANKGFKVEAGKDCFQEELLIMGGQFDCKVSGKDTNLLLK